MEPRQRSPISLVPVVYTERIALIIHHVSFFTLFSTLKTASQSYKDAD